MDLGRLTFLTVIGTQGRYIRNSGNEFAREYRVNYSRDGKLWKSWRNRQGNEVSDPNILQKGLNERREETDWKMGHEKGLSRRKNRRKYVRTDGGKTGERGRKKETNRIFFLSFFTLSCFWSFIFISEEITFTRQLPVGIRDPRSYATLLEQFKTPESCFWSEAPPSHSHGELPRVCADFWLFCAQQHKDSHSKFLRVLFFTLGNEARKHPLRSNWCMPSAETLKLVFFALNVRLLISTRAVVQGHCVREVNIKKYIYYFLENINLASSSPSFCIYLWLFLWFLSLCSIILLI